MNDEEQSRKQAPFGSEFFSLEFDSFLFRKTAKEVPNCSADNAEVSPGD